MNAGKALTTLAETLPEQEQLAPLLFIGHGSPMNGIEDNIFSQEWRKIAQQLPVPKAILVVSAHWLSRGVFVTGMENPRTIHDFGGFPRALYEVQYPAAGNKKLAGEVVSLLQDTNAGLDHEWGLDHGSWTILRQMYPDASIPVLQLSIDFYKPSEFHYGLGKQIAALRKKGVMIIGSGNLIHNLRMVDFANLDTPDYGYDWAREMHQVFKDKISASDHQSLIKYEGLGNAAKLAIPTPDHYYPLLYVLGAASKTEKPLYFNDVLVGGSLNMTSVLFQ